MNVYDILHDDFRDSGPYPLDEIKRLVESGKITPEQEVRRIGKKKSVSADYAMIFHAEDPEETESSRGDSSWKKLIGAAMCVLGLAVMGLLIYAFATDRPVSRRQAVVAVVLTLAGARIYQMAGRQDS